MSWTELQLGEMTEPERAITYGVVKPGPEDPEQGVRFVRGGDIYNGKIALDSLRTITQDVSRQYTRTLLRGGEVLISLVGNPGEVAIAPDSLAGANIARQAGLIALKPEYDPRFVMYFLMSPAGRAGLFERTQGAVQQVINLAALKTVKVKLPPLPAQQRIASILSAYDDLIENNLRRIALLEDAARQHYREWFVRFRFPGHEHVKLIDGMPEGWERKTLGDLADLVMGQSPKSQFYNQEGNGQPFHQGVTDYGFRFVTHRTYSTAITKLAEPNDILVSVRAPVGRINITLDRIVLGRGLAAVRSKTANQSFLFYALREHFYAEDIIGTGAIYAATNKKELEGQLLLIPPRQLIESFEDASVPIDRQIENLSRTIKQLTNARDLLLPRLMNGTLTV